MCPTPEALSQLVIVSDLDADRARALCRELGVHGLSVMLDARGAVLELTRLLQPTLVVLRASRGRIDGFALLAALKSDPRTRNEPVLMLGPDDRFARAECLALGASDYLTASLSPELAEQIAERTRRRAPLARRTDAPAPLPWPRRPLRPN